MPEGDTIRRLASRIDERFVGERCVESVARHPRLGGVDFAGAVLVGAEAVGKHLLLRFDDGRTLHSHLKMDGSWVMGRRSTAHEFSRRLELHFESGWLTGLDMPVIGVVSTVDEASVVGHLGPDLCATDATSLATDLARVAEHMGSLTDTPLASALLDQRLVAGFGNVFAVEVPFICGVSPFHVVADVRGLDHLLRVGAALIRFSADRPVRNTTGRRLHTSDHWAYGHARDRCGWCSTTLLGANERQTPWRRVTVWCPSCQPDPGSGTGAGTAAATVDTERTRRALALHPARRDPLLVR